MVQDDKEVNECAGQDNMKYSLLMCPIVSLKKSFMERRDK